MDPPQPARGICTDAALCLALCRRDQHAGDEAVQNYEAARNLQHVRQFNGSLRTESSMHTNGAGEHGHTLDTAAASTLQPLHQTLHFTTLLCRRVCLLFDTTFQLALWQVCQPIALNCRLLKLAKDTLNRQLDHAHAAAMSILVRLLAARARLQHDRSMRHMPDMLTLKTSVIGCATQPAPGCQ